MQRAVLLLVALVALSAARPIIEPYLGYKELMVPASTGPKPNQYKQSFHTYDSMGRSTHLEYDVEHHELLSVIDHEQEIEGILCSDEEVVVETISPAAGRYWAQKWIPGTILVGHRAWGCAAPGKTVATVMIRKVVKAVADNEGFVTVTTLPAQYTDVFKNAKINFQTSQLPHGREYNPDEARHPETTERMVRPSEDMVEEALPAMPRRESRQDVDVDGAPESILSDVGGWVQNRANSVENFASEVQSHVSNAVHDVVSIAQGNIGPASPTVNIYTLNWNDLKEQKQSDGPVVFDASVSCSSCYVTAGICLKFQFEVQNWDLTSLSATLNGNLDVNMQGTIEVEASASYAKQVTLANLDVPEPPVTFAIGPVPFTVDVLIDVEGGFNMKVSATGKIVSTIQVTGGFSFGFAYANGQLNRVAQHSLTKGGSLGDMSLELNANAEIFLLTTLTLQIDCIGGPTVAFRPASQLTLVYSNDNKCAKGSNGTDPEATHPYTGQARTNSSYTGNGIFNETKFTTLTTTTGGNSSSSTTASGSSTTTSTGSSTSSTTGSSTTSSSTTMMSSTTSSSTSSTTGTSYPSASGSGSTTSSSSSSSSSTSPSGSSSSSTTSSSTSSSSSSTSSSGSASASGASSSTSSGASSSTGSASASGSTTAASGSSTTGSASSAHSSSSSSSSSTSSGASGSTSSGSGGSSTTSSSSGGSTSGSASGSSSSSSTTANATSTSTTTGSELVDGRKWRNLKSIPEPIDALAGYGLEVSLTWGLQVFVGAAIDINIEGHDFYKNQLASVAVVTLNEPIYSGCGAQSSMALPAAASNDEFVKSHNLKMVPTPVHLQQKKTVMLGNVWAGSLMKRKDAPKTCPTEMPYTRISITAINQIQNVSQANEETYVTQLMINNMVTRKPDANSTEPREATCYGRGQYRMDFQTDGSAAELNLVEGKCVRCKIVRCSDNGRHFAMPKHIKGGFSEDFATLTIRKWNACADLILKRDQ